MTQIHADERRYKEITGEILAAAFAVANELGCGFLERVYENALFAELTMRGLKAQQQVAHKVRYKGAVVGDYFADLVVEDCVLVELKHVKDFEPAHTAQSLNYLKATGLKLCLLINFGKERVEWKRIANNL
jgi:GxxExxY protein